MRTVSYAEIENQVRLVKLLRDTPGSEDAAASAMERAKELWRNRREVPFGIQMKWPDDLHPLAVELGFAEQALDEAELAAHVAAASRLYQVAAQIDREIQSSVAGITDLRVAAAGDTIVLTGIAADNTAKSRAGSVAQQIAPTATIDNQLVIR